MIPADKIKKDDILYFEGKEYKSLIIVTNIRNIFIMYFDIEFYEGEIIVIKDKSISFQKWNDKKLLGPKYKYCEVEDLKKYIKLVFEYGVKKR